MRKIPPYKPKKAPKRTKNNRIAPLIDRVEKEQKDAKSGLLSGQEPENNGKTIKKRRDYSTKIIAKIHGVSESLVRKVKSGDRNNEDVLDTTIEYKQGEQMLISNLRKKKNLYQLADSVGRREDMYDFEEFCELILQEYQNALDKMIRDMEESLLGKNQINSNPHEN